ncbi:MAG TPA: thiamine-phosphate kinase [bacterium]|jgi:thiamine-monophosphate kinase|nr:thiamine-phosphate kinase [bacterium]
MSPNLSDIGEFGLIARICNEFGRLPDEVCGIGDDCAVIPMNDRFDMLITVDSIYEGIDFDLRFSSPLHIGKKALAINLSDIAAMGGIPKYFLVSIALPLDSDLDFVEGIYSGISDVARESGAALVGGDTSSSEKEISISITAIGEVEKGRAILRKGARPGDPIFISGAVGLSALGLAALKMGTSSGMEPFIERHLSPLHRTDLGRTLLKLGCVTSMIDVSDGLLADLGHIARSSGVGFEIDVNRIPAGDDFRMASAAIGVDPRELLLAGGEDFELVFTADSGRIHQSLASLEALGVAEIGRVLDDPGVRSVLNAEDLVARGIGRGYDHFLKERNCRKEPG